MVGNKVRKPFIVTVGWDSYDMKYVNSTLLCMTEHCVMKRGSCVLP